MTKKEAVCEHNPYKKVIYCDDKIKATKICG